MQKATRRNRQQQQQPVEAPLGEPLTASSPSSSSSSAAAAAAAPQSATTLHRAWEQCLTALLAVASEQDILDLSTRALPTIDTLLSSSRFRIVCPPSAFGGCARSH